ncbi:MAG: FAD-dependent oxidoreductase [Sedimentisphaerales bacterium]|nr:FAD-dependent oxidoreductase [Sedimentisphaerales bacterium]
MKFETGNMAKTAKEVTILGAGPAGLAAALELTRNGVTDVLLIDVHSQPGGLSRTLVFEDARFDIGSHRFFTKNKEVNDLWHNLLGEDFQPVQRLSRIYYKNKFFNYPLKPFNALKNLGCCESVHAILSYLWASMRPSGKEAETFEQWISRRFGRKLYLTFFKTYTEKVWGIECNRIGADWAAQRIKGMSLVTALLNSLKSTGKAGKAKSLVDEFDYPKYGAGMMYDKMAQEIRKTGGQFMFDTSVKKIVLNQNRVTSVIVETDGQETELPVNTVFSSIPLTTLVKSMTPGAPDNVFSSADELYFRDHITANLIVEEDNLFDDQWIYIHSPEVKMARLANYNNFSRCMSANGASAVGVEYFVFRNDSIWNLPDHRILELAKQELHRMNLINKNSVNKGFVVRETDCYPTYFLGFEKPFQKLKEFVCSIDNLQCIGRGGMYKYNNQDHSIYTGLLAARNHCGADHNLWDVNIDAEYHEGSQRQV